MNDQCSHIKSSFFFILFLFLIKDFIYSSLEDWKKNPNEGFYLFIIVVVSVTQVSVLCFYYSSSVRKFFSSPFVARAVYLLRSRALGLIGFVSSSLALKVRAQQCRIPPTCSVCTAAWPLTPEGAPVTHMGVDLGHKELSSLFLSFRRSFHSFFCCYLFILLHLCFS